MPLPVFQSMKGLEAQQAVVHNGERLQPASIKGRQVVTEAKRRDSATVGQGIKPHRTCIWRKVGANQISQTAGPGLEALLQEKGLVWRELLKPGRGYGGRISASKLYLGTTYREPRIRV